MSIEAELHGKGGQVCRHAKLGEIKCPLIIRQTSEDVMTSSVFGLLKHVRPHLWLGPLLNLGLGMSRFRQVWYKGLKLHFWQRVARYPPELLTYKEGHTEPDLALTWENPPTTIWIESKYLSPLALKTANSDTDQALRGIRTLLAATGHIVTPALFDRPRRNAVWLALLLTKPEPIVDQYRNESRLIQAIGCPDAVAGFPPSPFVGTITWKDINVVLRRSRKMMVPGERSIADSVDAYLKLKLAQAAEAKPSLPPLSGLSRSRSIPASVGLAIQS